MGRYPITTQGATGFEDFPDGWEDSAIVSKVKRNRDGSITVNIQIDVQGDEGDKHLHFQAYRTIRLERTKVDT